MKDIQKAMKCEQIYLQYRSINTEMNFLKLISHCGYETIDDYFNDKYQELIKNLGIKILYLTTDESDAIGFKAVDDKEPMLIIDRIPRLTAWVGLDDPISEEKAQKLGVDVRYLPYHGGVIIGGEDDIALVFITPDNLIPNDYFQKRITTFFSKYCNADVKGNDIMIENKKVAGCANYFSNGMNSLLIQLTFSDHLDVIKNLCVQNIEKPVGYISAIKLSDFISEVISWVN